MFRILIVEDNVEKLKAILEVLDAIEGIDVDAVEHEVDSLGAKKRLQNSFYDLLILDIAIPLRKAESVDLEGGIKLLHEISVRDIYKKPSHIIGLTAYDEIFSKAQAEFASSVLSVISFSNINIEWKKYLQKGVEQMIMSKKDFISDKRCYNYDIAIINAIEREFDAVKALSQSWSKVPVPQDSSPYYETTFESKKGKLRVVAACASHMGMNASAILSMKMIHNFRPRYIFMTGIAASVKEMEQHGYGDIILIDESWDGGAGKILTGDKGKALFHPTANHLRLDRDVAEQMRNIKDDHELLRQIKDAWKPGTVPNTELTMHIGSVVSVSGVIENKAVIEELKKQDRKLLGLEMEAYGMYYSAANCSNPKPTAIAIKSVADFAITGKSDNYQAYASYTSARVMYEFIISEL